MHASLHALFCDRSGSQDISFGGEFGCFGPGHHVKGIGRRCSSGRAGINSKNVAQAEIRNLCSSRCGRLPPSIARQGFLTARRMRSPDSLCQAVVTLWRFIHDALDAPLSLALQLLSGACGPSVLPLQGLGLPVDIVVSPFIKDFLGKATGSKCDRHFRICPRYAEVLQRSAERLVRPCEESRSLREPIEDAH